MPRQIINAVLSLMLICGCTSHHVKPWHQALSRPILPYIGNGIPQITESHSAESPPRGPDADWEAIQKIHIGASGSEINRLTGCDPFYSGDFAFLTTHSKKSAYEVAFRYSKDGAGKIVDISYLPVSEEQVKMSRGL